MSICPTSACLSPRSAAQGGLFTTEGKGDLGQSDQPPHNFRLSNTSHTSRDTRFGILGAKPQRPRGSGDLRIGKLQARTPSLEDQKLLHFHLAL